MAQSLASERWVLGGLGIIGLLLEGFRGVGVKQGAHDSFAGWVEISC